MVTIWWPDNKNLGVLWPQPWRRIIRQRLYKDKKQRNNANENGNYQKDVDSKSSKGKESFKKIMSSASLRRTFNFGGFRLWDPSNYSYRSSSRHSHQEVEITGKNINFMALLLAQNGSYLPHGLFTGDEEDSR